MSPLIVFSHLRWDFVYQRPQQLMTRLARYYKVYFIEEPLHDPGAARWEMTQPADNVWVCRPHTAVSAAGFHDDQLAGLRVLLDELVAAQELRDPLVWLYTPMAVPLIAALDPRAVFYDCMDELAAFKNAPRQLVQREHALLKLSDLVFTGGRSLYRAKQSRHDAVYCFPSSVEAAHFGAARAGTREHPLQAPLPHPRLGFFGVIDERLDIRLLGDVAEAHPEWQIAMVGPVVKIDPESLPRRPNIHYFGEQRYADLPSFLAGWDVCLLPFALNEATRFISPTKTLEYMAAGKPIVSTPVADVVEPYSGVVRIGTGGQFISECAAALAETLADRERRSSLMADLVSKTSWDQTAARMHELMQSCNRQQLRRARSGEAALPVLRESGGVPRRPPVVIVGAGPTGLSAAYHLGDDAVLLEQNKTVGGWCRSIEENGYTFDYAGHIMFSNEPYVHQLYKILLGDNMHWQDREAWVHSKGVYTRYPFQGALHGLPPEVVSECIMGAIEARVGPLADLPGSTPARGSFAGSSPSVCKAESLTDCCADGLQESTAPLQSMPPAATRGGAPRNFEEFIYRVWGKGIAKHFAVPYNRKLWTVPLSSMETSWLGGRVPVPDLREMIEGALRPVPKPMGPNARFGYPLRGGFQALMDGFVARLRGPLQLEARVVRVVPSRHAVILSNDSVHAYEQLISTMPLPVLVRLAAEEAPPAVRLAASRLRHVSVRCVNLGIGRANVSDKHWIYYPDAAVFHRIFLQGNASPHCNPPNGFGLTCEISYSPDKPLPCDGDALIDRCIADCIEVGMIRPDDPIIARNQLDMPYAYVVYDHGRADNVAAIRDWAREHDIILAGRYSEWEYYNSDHAFVAGRKAALQASAALSARAKLHTMMATQGVGAPMDTSEYMRVSP